MLIAKIVKVAKFELHCETISQITNIVNYTVTTARFKLLRVASACQGNHIEVPQSAAVAGALRGGAPYHRKHRGSTFLEVPHAPHGYGRTQAGNLLP